MRLDNPAFVVVVASLVVGVVAVVVVDVVVVVGAKAVFSCSSWTRMRASDISSVVKCEACTWRSASFNSRKL